MNLHLTWAFIGEVQEEVIPDIQARLRREVDFLQEGTDLKALADSFMGMEPIVSGIDGTSGSGAARSKKAEPSSLDLAEGSLGLSVENALAREQASPVIPVKPLSIHLEYKYMEAWPSVMAGRVLVATPDVVPDQVLRIGMSLRSALAEFSTADKDEARNLLFRPHVTIARLNPPDNFGDGRLLNDISALLPIKHHITSLHLIKSDPVAGLYKIIDTPW
ncbi:MAG: hypothetical protein JSS83_06605 [Cyanobacteria bacterium SZAS LIN-3]|nr:hypothetical protein [Cyanobacteria bacterium SZAS LIN-3]